MDEVVQFLRNAEDCLSQAAKASDAVLREQFEQLAIAWTSLAVERQKFLGSAEPQGQAAD